MEDDKIAAGAPPKKHSLFRLVVDQARIDQSVQNYGYEGSGTTENPYVVTFIPEDAGNPQNWSSGRKWTITMVVAVECFATAFSSSAFSGTLRELYIHFQADLTLITAGISLFVLGFAVGPLIWAPLSEIFGRQIVYIATFAAFTAFSAACTADSGIATLLVMRFFAGSFGSSPFTNAGGVIADIFTANERGLAMALFALAPSFGPTLGPAIGGFLGQSEGWRWVMGLMAIFVGAMWILGSLFVPETYAPVILKKRAEKLSQMTGKVYKTKVQIDRGDATFAQTMKVALVRPWILLFMEPIVLVLSIYLAIIYGTLYLLFGAYPIVFQVGRGWSEGIGGLAFLGVAVGMLSAVFFQGIANKWYIQAAEKNGGVAPPEARMVPAMIGAISIPVGMFWFAWTNYPSVHWFVPVAAGAPFGFGLTLIFLAISSYLIDAYTIFAASVLAANAVLRSLFGAAFPLFTRDMYARLGIHWASSVPAFLALACLPAPFVLYKYGAAIRARCVYASEAEKAMEMLRASAVAKEQNGVVGTQRTSSTVTDDLTDVEAGKESLSFEPIRTRTRTNTEIRRTRTRGSSIAEAAAYEASPFDIDRVMTHNTVTGLDLKKVRTNMSSAGRE